MSLRTCSALPARRTWCAVFLVFSALPAGGWFASQSCAAEFPYRHWTASKPIFGPGPKGTFDEVAAKDPSIVFFEGKYHLFYTSKPGARSTEYEDGTGYVAAPTLEGLRNAKRHDLNKLLGGAIIAPQVFYFRPRRLWYLIGQTPVDRPCKLAPVYSTNADIDDVAGWSKPKLLETGRRDRDGFWIDFWVICDAEKAHLFYTDHAGSMFRMETPLARFPDGLAGAREQLAVRVHGTDSRGPWRLHEGSHIYYVKSEEKYLALLEAVRPHPTKRNYWDSRNRFMFAMTAERLEGPWKRVEDEKNDFIGIPAYVFNEDESPTAYDQVSHPELIRSGYGERLAIDDYRLQMLFQAFDAAGMPDSYDYDLLPWELSVMRNY